MVYDGAVVLKTKSGLLEKIFSISLPSSSSKQSLNRQAGFLPMLPNWVEEVLNGTDINKLIQWVNEVASRQVLALSGFDPRPNYHKFRQKLANQVKASCHKRFLKLKAHVELCQVH